MRSACLFSFGHRFLASQSVRSFDLERDRLHCGSATSFGYDLLLATESARSSTARRQFLLSMSVVTMTKYHRFTWTLPLGRP
jgi:hypothetical protein